jgi:2-phosphosulfolactate phosphatase
LHETGVGDFLKRLRVLMTRQEIVPERLAGATAVVFDVFMATTTLLTILENGARNVYPAASLGEADQVMGRLETGSLLRGGEQDAGQIEGYDHGPFPEEYAPEVVRGKDVIFVTTNGTRAIADAAPADTVLLGTLRNARAVAHHLEASGTGSIYLVCAGAGGRFTLEDFLGATTLLSYMDVDDFRLNDGARLALDFAERHTAKVYETLIRSRAGRWFVDNDRMDAFDFVADVDASGLVPEVVGGKLQRANEGETRTRLGVSDAGQGVRG